MKKTLNPIGFLKIMKIRFKHRIAMIMVVARRTGKPRACAYKHRICVTNQFCCGSDALFAHFISSLEIFLVSVNTFAISSRIAKPFCFSSSGTIASLGLIVI